MMILVAIIGMVNVLVTIACSFWLTGILRGIQEVLENQVVPTLQRVNQSK